MNDLFSYKPLPREEIEAMRADIASGDHDRVDAGLRRASEERRRIERFYTKSRAALRCLRSVARGAAFRGVRLAGQFERAEALIEEVKKVAVQMREIEGRGRALLGLVATED